MSNKLNIILLGIVLVFLSCKKGRDIPLTSYDDELEMQKWDSIYNDFQIMR